MSRHPGIRIVKVLLVLAVAVIGIVAVITIAPKITPTTQAVCVHGSCPPGPTDDVYSGRGKGDRDGLPPRNPPRPASVRSF
jgi:hypothetical protein